MSTMTFEIFFFKWNKILIILKHSKYFECKNSGLKQFISKSYAQKKSDGKCKIDHLEFYF